MGGSDTRCGGYSNIPCCRDMTISLMPLGDIVGVGVERARVKYYGAILQSRGEMLIFHLLEVHRRTVAIPGVVLMTMVLVR